MSVFDIIITYHEAFLEGLVVTLHLSLIIWSVGIVLGAGLGIWGAKHWKSVGIPSRVFSFALSGVPILVFLFWLHYPAQAVFDMVIDPFITGTITLCIVNIFGVADIVRGALLDFPRQYMIAGHVCGLTQKQLIYKIQLPLIFREILPPLLILQVVMLHTTLFTSLISVEEIFRVAQRINAQIYKPVEIYTALGFFFLLVSLPINGLAYWLKHKFTRNLSEQ